MARINKPAEVKIEDDGTVVEDHESYALAGVFRSSHGGGDIRSGCNLFASSIVHRETVCLQIKRATKRRHLNRDWYHGREELISIRMSPSQFADLITLQNIGDGHPVTLEYFNGKHMSECPEENERLRLESEFESHCKEVMGDAKALADRAMEILGGRGTMKVEERKELAEVIGKLCSQITSTVPFIQSSFNEAIDKTASAAKAEVDAFIERKIHSVGLESIQNQIRESSPVIKELPNAAQVSPKS